MSTHIAERDWKQFSKLKPELWDRACKKIIDRAAQITTSKANSPSEQYVQLYKFIEEEDRKMAALSDHRRSTAIMMIAAMYGQGMMTEEELMTFSEETREVVLLICRRPLK